METEPNSTLQRAQEVSAPVTINGQIYGERDVDYYRIPLETDQLLVCEVLAGRIGSSLDPLVEILDSSGKKLTTSICFLGSDPVIALRAPKTGYYLLRVGNISFHGSASHVYRINLTHKPIVQAAFPPGGQADTTRELEFLLFDGTAEGTLLKKTVTFPGHTNSTPTSFTLQPHEHWQPTTLTVSARPNHSEQEPNDQVAEARPIALGDSVYGQFATVTDQDWFRLATKQGVTYTISCQAAGPLYQANPILTVYNSAGKKLKEVRSIESQGHIRLNWEATKDEDLLLRARDLRYGAVGGFSLIYQLNIAPAGPDFQLNLPVTQIQLLQGAKTTVDLEVTRSGKQLGPIKISADNLPPGVQLESLEIPAKQKGGKLVFVASDDAVAQSVAIQIKGSAQEGETNLERKASIGHLGVDSEGRSIADSRLDQIPFTVIHKPIFRLHCSEAYLYAHRGSVFPYLMEVERQAGFKGKIVLQISDRQNRDLDGIEMHEVEIPPDTSQVMLPIYLPETMHINIQSQSQLYCQGYASFTDPHGQPQTFLAVSEKRNMLRTLPPVIKLKAIHKELTSPVGQSIRCRFQLERTSNFSGPMTLSLVGSQAQTGYAFDPLTIPAGQTEIECDLQTGNVTGPRQLTFRATGQLSDQIIISETTVTVNLVKKKP